MRRVFIAVLLMVCFSSGVGYAQLARLGQLEIYGGVGIPLTPEEFKDFYKVGVSLNAQYVFFPASNIGIPFFAGYELFTVDNGAISDFFAQGVTGVSIFDDFGNYLGQITGAQLDADGSASSFRFGAGIRPYLTPSISPVQFFLFANGSMNFLKTKTELKGGKVTFQDAFGNEQDLDFSELGIEPENSEDTENKFGLAAGAGIEVPAGPTMNLIFQGLYHIIFTSGDKTSFLGVTAGLVF
ncbi:MAG: hypothetical protein D6715_11760 [Calditrichaeota bacterium]|nr:MAG: hypothetical protein D6715_11760 [Calditrichota bacterium]